MGRVDQVPVADIDPDMPRLLARAIATNEEDKVTRLEPVRRNPDCVGRVILPRRVVWQGDAELRKHVLDETRTVEPGLRLRATPLVRDAEVGNRDRDDGVVLRGGRQATANEKRVGR